MRVFRNLFDFITHHAFVFVIFLLLFIVSVCSVLYTINFLQNTTYGEYRSSEDERAFVVQVKDVDLTRKLQALIGERKAELQHVYCIVSNEDDVIIADFYGHRFNRDGVSVGSWFSEEDFARGAKKIILPNYQYIYSQSDIDAKDMLSIGDTYYIGETAYQAIGMGLLDVGFQVPYNSIDDTSIVTNVVVALYEIKNKEVVKEFAEYLSELLYGQVVAMPTEFKQNSFFVAHPIETILIVGIMSVSVFSLVYIYIYILETRKREIAIQRIVGQNITSAIFHYYAEVFLLSSLSYLLSVILVKFGILHLLWSEGYLFADTLNFSTIAIVYAVMIGVCSAVFLPAIVYNVKKSPAEAVSDM